VVDAFLSASRQGDFEALVGMLDPDIVFRADHQAVLTGAAEEFRGAVAVAGYFSGRAQAARPVLIDGALGVVVAPLGQLLVALRLNFRDGRIVGIEAIAEPESLGRLELRISAEPSS
jgi:hypothetical protein